MMRIIADGRKFIERIKKITTVFSSISDDLHDCVVDLPSFQFCALLVYYHSRLVNTKLVFNCISS